MAAGSKVVLLPHLFPTFQGLEGEMLVSFYALKALQLKGDLTIF